MNVETAPLPVRRDLVSVILPFISDGNEILRSSALRALAVIGASDPGLPDALAAALDDPDPDVRSDAMQLFAEVARPEDDRIIVGALAGDPVREVKLAAIRALGRLRATDGLDILRALAADRCEDRVVWEDDQGDWDDWLDIQVAAIEALGDLGDTGAIEILTGALHDEFGQTLDTPVFAAFRALGDTGIARLVDYLEDSGALRRRRAATELAKAEAGVLEKHLDRLLSFSEPEIRQSALAALAPEDRRCRAMARSDPDPGVRRAALLRAARAHSGLAVACLSDDSESVRAAALSCLSDDERASLNDDLVPQLRAWIQYAGPELAGASSRELALLAPRSAGSQLLDVARSDERPLGARVAAVRACEGLELSEHHGELGDLLASPVQQLRTAVLNVLWARVRDGDVSAAALIARAIGGTLLSDDEGGREVPSVRGNEAGVPKGEGGGKRRIRISSDGEILELDARPDQAVQQGKSTIDEIQSGNLPTGDGPEEAGFRRGRRQSVEGPDGYADDLSTVAISLASDLDSSEVRGALVSRLEDSNDAVRAAAWNALVTRSVNLAAIDGFDVTAHAAAGDRDARVRLSAFSCLERLGSVGATLIHRALTDVDGLVRAWAVARAEPDCVARFVNDPHKAVRDAAAERLSKEGTPGEYGQAIRTAIYEEKAAPLQALIGVDGNGLTYLTQAVAAVDLTPRRIRTVLDAVSGVAGS